MNTTACCAELVQPNKYCLNPGVGPSPLQFQAGCQTTSRCKEESVTSKLSFFKEKIHELDLAEKACEDSRKGCQDYYSCTTQQTVWKMQHSYCNLNQTAFEEAWCHYAAQVEAEFEGFAVCFDHRRTDYLQYETEQKAQLVIRQQEWRALVRIRCFTRAFEHAFQKSGRFEEMLKNCAKMEYNSRNIPVKLNTAIGHYRKYQPRCHRYLWAPGSERFNEHWYFSKYLQHIFPVKLMPSSLRTAGCVSALPTSHCPVVGSQHRLLLAQAQASRSTAKPKGLLKRRSRVHRHVHPRLQ